jgi:hypothetical protein
VTTASALPVPARAEIVTTPGALPATTPPETVAVATFDELQVIGEVTVCPAPFRTVAVNSIRPLTMTIAAVGVSSTVRLSPLGPDGSLPPQARSARAVTIDN